MDSLERVQLELDLQKKQDEKTKSTAKSKAISGIMQLATTPSGMSSISFMKAEEILDNLKTYILQPHG